MSQIKTDSLMFIPTPQEATECTKCCQLGGYEFSPANQIRRNDTQVLVMPEGSS